MKKISNLEISSLVVIITVTMYAGINIDLIKEITNTNAWISVIISNIIGLIPLLLYLYICNYKPSIPINKKINSLFKKSDTIINIIICIILLFIGITILYNTNNFITTQLLYRTPHILIAILLVLISSYHVSKGINSITRVSIIMLTFNIILSSLGFFSLIPEINIENFMPVLKINTNNIIPSSFKLASINSLPIILVSTIPKEKSTNPNKYNKSIILAYLIGALISLSIIIETYGILGVHLVKIFEYPEYIVYKKIVLLGFLERVENIISSQWIIGNYVYLTLIIYYISNTINLNIKNNKLISSLLIGTVIIIIKLTIFNNNIIFYNYTKNIFAYICMSLFIIYILITIKIFIDKKRIKSNNN